MVPPSSSDFGRPRMERIPTSGRIAPAVDRRPGAVQPVSWGDRGLDIDKRTGAGMRRIGMVRAAVIVAALASSSRAGDPSDALNALSGDNVLKHIKVLASDEFEGRGPGTPGE